MKSLVVDMENELHTAVKIEALKRGKSGREYIIELVKKDLQKKKKE